MILENVTALLNNGLDQVNQVSPRAQKCTHRSSPVHFEVNYLAKIISQVGGKCSKSMNVFGINCSFINNGSRVYCTSQNHDTWCLLRKLGQALWT